MAYVREREGRQAGGAGGFNKGQFVASPLAIKEVTELQISVNYLLGNLVPTVCEEFIGDALVVFPCRMLSI